MGVPGLFGYFAHHFPHIIEKRVPTELVDYLLLDFNGMLYNAHDETITPFELMEKVCFSIDTLIEKWAPVYTFVGIDGTVPLAKMVQQRDRRNIKINHKEHVVNTNEFTPGTRFMDQLDRHLEKRYKGTERVIVSPSSSPGEGEHKCISLLREGNISNKRIFVWGMDADLMILLLPYLEKNNKIWIVRFHDDSFKFLNLTTLRDCIYAEIGFNDTFIIRDLAAIFSFLGNDFLPQMPFLLDHNGRLQCNILFDSYREYYRKNKRPIIIENTKIHNDMFKTYLNYLLPYEESFYKRKRIAPKRVSPDEFFLRKKDYLMGFLWVIRYYNGITNWSFYYPHRTAPMIKDLIQFLKNKNINFMSKTLERGRTRPYPKPVHLAYVFPKWSLKYIPEKCFREALYCLPCYPSEPPQIPEEELIKPEWHRKPLLEPIDIDYLESLFYLFFG